MEQKKAKVKETDVLREGKYYRLINPTDSKLMFKIKDDAVGRASRDFVCLSNAKDEISKHRIESMNNLIAELRKAKRTTMGIQIGNTVSMLSIKHVDAKEVIVIEK